jgi:hypothetical protein
MDTSQSENICKSCGTVFRGTYCNNCGEKVLSAQDRSFKAFLNNLFQALTLVDGKVVKTLWLILRKPGFISGEYVAGRRVNYLKPLSLFFALNLIYFLLPVIQLFNASLKTQLNSSLGLVIQDLVAHKMIQENILNVNSFSLIYDQKTTGLAKLIVMVFVIIASLPLNILYRKKGFYFVDHMTYMVELVCFNLFINALFLTLVLRFTGLGHYTDDQILTIIFVTTNLYFLIFSGNIFYKEKGWKLVAKSILMLLFLRVAQEIYRAVLFFITIWTM